MPVYDLSYRRLEGVRRPRSLRFLPIATFGVRLFFRRRIYLLLGLVALVPFFLMMFTILAPHVFETLTPADFPEEFRAFFHLSGTGLYVYLARFEWVFLFLFAALAGGGQIANDLRANALEIYFSRPLTRLDYVLGKLGVVMAILLGVTLLPCVLLWLADVSLANEPGFAAQQAPLLLRAAGASLVVTLPYALFVLAASAVARTARTAMIVFAAAERLLAISSFVAARMFDEERWRLLSPLACMRRVAYAVLDADRQLLAQVTPSRRPVPLADEPVMWALSSLLLFCAAAAWLLVARIRAVEVVEG